jgi:MFS family permease
MPKGYARYVLAVMVGINFLNYLDRFILPVAASQVKEEFHLTDAQLGGLATAFLLVYALAAVPFGIWADRGVRTAVIGTGVAIWSLATLFTGFARNYLQLFITRAVLGIGEASYYPAGTSLLADYFPKASRARAMSIWGAGTAAGIAVGFSLGGLVASRLGWRAAFYITAVPGLVLALLAFKLREPVRGAAEAHRPAGGRTSSLTLRNVAGLLSIPTLRATILAETMLFFVLAGAANWLPIFLNRRFGLGVGGAGTLAGGVLVLGGLAGTLLGGWLGDWQSRRVGTGGNLQVGIVGFLAGAVFVTAALLAPSLTSFTPFFFLGVLSLYLYSGPYTAIKQNVVVPGLRASAVMVALLVEHLFGDSFSPLAIGKLSDTVHSLPMALLLLLPPFLLLAALVAATGLGSAERDARLMEERWAGSRAGSGAIHHGFVTEEI